MEMEEGAASTGAPIKIKLRLGGALLSNPEDAQANQAQADAPSNEPRVGKIILKKRALEEASGSPAAAAFEIVAGPPSAGETASARPPKKRKATATSSTHKKRPHAHPKRDTGYGEEDEDDEFVANELHGRTEEAHTGEGEQENGEEGGTKIRRSQRRRTTERNKYVIYDTLDDDDYFHEIEKQAEAGKIDFVATIMQHNFYDPAEILTVHENGKDVGFGTIFKKQGFRKPILFKVTEGLGMKLPSRDFDIDAVADHVGNRELDVIDVVDQSELRPPWRMEDWVQYFNTPPEQRTKTLNVISLEFSGTKLAQKVRAPKFVRKADWVDVVWPRELKERALNPQSLTQLGPQETSTTATEIKNGEAEGKQEPAKEESNIEQALAGLEQLSNAAEAISTSKVAIATDTPDSRAFYPKVQLYCLMSVQGSYTDFHIDFGGSSVWYHVLWGKKIFFMIPPTQENLRRYEKWASSPNQGSVFLAKKVDKCYKIELEAGNTMLIPTGWIHAVYTPADSLVFGGNFIHGFNIETQLKCHDIEEKTRTEGKFRFPLFEMMQWYAARAYLNRLKEGKPITEWEREGLVALVDKLTRWLSHSNEAERLKHRGNVPLEIPSPETLLQELTQALPQPPPEKVDIKQEHQPIKIIIKKSVLSPSLTSADAPGYSFEDHLAADIEGAAVPASKRPSKQTAAKKPKKAKTEEGSDGDEFSLNGTPKPKKKKAPPKPKKEPAKKEPAKKEPAKKEPAKKEEKAPPAGPATPAQEAARRASLSLSGAATTKNPSTARGRLLKKISSTTKGRKY